MNQICVATDLFPVSTFTNARTYMLSALFLITLGCQDPLVQERQFSDDNAAMLTEGYSLLYHVVSQQKDAHRLFIMRNAAPMVRDSVTAVAQECGQLYEWLGHRKSDLETISIRFDAADLPQIEAESRETIAIETAAELLLDNEFERCILLSQIKSTQYLSALARAIATYESSDARRDRLKRFASRMSELHDQMTDLVTVIIPVED